MLAADMPSLLPAATAGARPSASHRRASNLLHRPCPAHELRHGFDQHRVPYVERPDLGKMKDVAFVKDPDGYWIEIVEPGRLRGLGLAAHSA
ncbi:hypothetical protein BH11PSE8_BH11PSE8_30810 [soil metagenome]